MVNGAANNPATGPNIPTYLGHSFLKGIVGLLLPLPLSLFVAATCGSPLILIFLGGVNPTIGLALRTLGSGLVERVYSWYLFLP